MTAVVVVDGGGLGVVVVKVLMVGIEVSMIEEVVPYMGLSADHQKREAE